MLVSFTECSMVKIIGIFLGKFAGPKRFASVSSRKLSNGFVKSRTVYRIARH